MLKIITKLPHRYTGLNFFRICQDLGLNTFLRLSIQNVHLLSFLNIVYSTIEWGQAQMMMGWGGGRGKWHNFQGSHYSIQHPPWVVLYRLNHMDTQNYRNLSRIFFLLVHKRGLNCVIHMCKTFCILILLIHSVHFHIRCNLLLWNWKKHVHFDKCYRLQQWEEEDLSL